MGGGVVARIPLKATPALAAYDWTGFYLGGHFGYGTGSLGHDTNAEPLQGDASRTASLV